MSVSEIKINPGALVPGLAMIARGGRDASSALGFEAAQHRGEFLRLMQGEARADGTAIAVERVGAVAGRFDLDGGQSGLRVGAASGGDAKLSRKGGSGKAGAARRRG